MRVQLGIRPSTCRHLTSCYDRGYLDHQWGYERRDRSALTEPEEWAYQAGWRAAGEDGTAGCYDRPHLSASAANAPSVPQAASDVALGAGEREKSIFRQTLTARERLAPVTITIGE
jgi:hypothetical protein